MFRKNVGNIIPWMPVQSLFQPLLVHVVTDETNRPAEHEQRVDGSNVDVLLRLFRRKTTAILQHIDECASDDAVDVQNEVRFLAGGDLFDFERVE